MRRIMNALPGGTNKIYQNLGNDKFPRFFCCKSKNKVLECKTKTELKYRLITQNRFLTPNSYFYGVYFLSRGAIISIFQTAGISKFA